MNVSKNANIFFCKIIKNISYIGIIMKGGVK